MKKRKYAIAKGMNAQAKRKKSVGFASQPSHTAQINEPETFDSEKGLCLFIY